MATEFVRAGTVDEVRATGRTVVGVGGRPVLVLADGDRFFAIDNRCPHMGFPLDRGDVHDGLLDCHWHHARFDLTCGATLDPWADDVDSYAVTVEDGVVLVDPRRPPRDPREHGLGRLDRGLDDNLRLVTAKAVLELEGGGVDPRVGAATAARFGATRRRGGWAPGLSILASALNVLPALRERDRPRALVHAFAHVAGDCAGRPPRRPLPGLEGSGRSREGLAVWLRETVEVRDEDGTERVLRTLVTEHGTRAALAAVLAAATDHRYSDVGHTLDYAVKCAELSDHLDGFGEPEDAAHLFTSLAPQLVGMIRMEEKSSWRRPVDVAALVAEAARDLPAEAFDDPGDEVLKDEDEFVARLLADDPAATVSDLLRRLEAGASPVALAEAVVSAATRRVLAFGTANELSDWNTVHHTLTYTNAVAEGMRLAPSPELFRAVLDGAMSVYLDRFLNVPPADDLGRAGDAAAPGEALDELLDTYDRRASVSEATRLAGAFLETDGSPEDLLATLGHAVLREDAGFHPIQQLDVAWRRLARRGPGEEATRALAACARWLAAHFPTPRAREQTFRIARRLSRGDRLHEESPDRRDG